MWKFGEILLDKIKNVCEVCGSDNKIGFIDGKYYCGRHYQQMKTYGYIKTRTVRDLNEIVLYDTYAEIILYNKDCKEEARALIDIEDVEKCKKYKWKLTKDKYAMNHKLGRLHNYIMNFFPPKDKSKVVNHKNRHRIDCRKNNLEITTYQVNGINKGKQSNNTSGFVGVSWDKSRNKWEANIKFNRKKIFLGYFKDIRDAVKARQDGEIKYFGELVNRENDKYTVFKHEK